MKRYSRGEIIKASEIGQFKYCSVKWYLQKCGIVHIDKNAQSITEEKGVLYVQKIPSIEKGKEFHIDLGKKIEVIEEKEEKSKLLSYIGYFLLLIILALLVAWIIL